MSKHFAILLVATIVGSHVPLRAADVERPTPPAGQEERIAAEIDRLRSSNESECAVAVKALVKTGKPAAPALVKVLSDPRNEVRAFAAEALRAILAADPTSAPNYHEKAYWEQRLAQLKAGMALDEALKVLLPELTPAERQKRCEGVHWSGGSGTSGYRLDDYWAVWLYLVGFEHKKLHEHAPDLFRSVRQVWVALPPDYTGVRMTWYVNGQKANESQYSNGRHDGIVTAFYDDGPKCYKQHYTMGVCQGTDTAWYRSGKKRYEGEYENNKQTGTWQWWKENGDIESIREYKDGKQVESRDH
jgi:hypothetical protein